MHTAIRHFILVLALAWGLSHGAVASAKALSHNENIAKLLGVRTGEVTEVVPQSAETAPLPKAVPQRNFWLACLVFGGAWASVGYILLLWMKTRAVPQKPERRGQLLHIRDVEPTWASAIKSKAISAAPKSKNYKKSKAKSA